MKRPHEKFKVGDKVYWRSSSNGRDFLKAGHVIGIVPAHQDFWTVIEKLGINNTNHSYLWKLEDRRFIKPKDHETYLVSVTYHEQWERKHALPQIYWPIVASLKHDTRQPLPRMFLSED